MEIFIRVGLVQRIWRVSEVDHLCFLASDVIGLMQRMAVTSNTSVTARLPLPRSFSSRLYNYHMHYSRHYSHLRSSLHSH